MDQVSAGRIGWNMVTGSSDVAARNYGLDGLPEHDLRYDMADEYMAGGERGCGTRWEPGAHASPIPASGVLVDHTKVHQVDFEGRCYRTRGPLNSGPCPQGRPVIAQAGGSPARPAIRGAPCRYHRRQRQGRDGDAGLSRRRPRRASPRSGRDPTG